MEKTTKYTHVKVYRYLNCMQNTAKKYITNYPKSNKVRLPVYTKKAANSNMLLITTKNLRRISQNIHKVQSHISPSDVLLVSPCTNGWMDGWLGFNGILSTQVAAISCLRKFKVC